jgi:hypothetical protein
MSEEPKPQPRNAKGQLLPGHTLSNKPKDPGKWKANDVASLRTAMLRAIGGREDLKAFLEKLVTGDPRTYAKILATLEPKDAKQQVQQQVVVVMYPEPPPANWKPADIKGEAKGNGRDETKQSVSHVSLGVGI